jgi:peptide chain release factor 1
MLKEKAEQLLKKLPELETELGNPEVFSDQKRFKQLSQEHSYLSDLKAVYEELCASEKEFADNKDLLKEETDPEFVEMLQAEVDSLAEKLPQLEQRLSNLLVPPNPDDSRTVIVELRAGTGGDEAALFVGDCVRMYKFYAEKQSWRYEEIDATPAEVGGYKEYVMSVAGANVHRFMQYEAGTHRVQRVPETETQGRVHTSAITVAILMEPGEEEAVVIDEKDIRVDTYRASGAGGQHVNTTDSAVRITHIPTGIVSYCQQEKSQHKNKDKAMRLLKAKIAEERRLAAAKERADARSMQVGSGDRSERIRTYNFPQNRITDHRINLTLYKLDQAMNGELSDVSEALVSHYHQKQLEATE